MAKRDGALGDAAELRRRAGMLAMPHVAPIEAWRRSRTGAERPLPHVDPLDGGAEARLLLLLETPGPGASPLRFVSRDNATGTGANLRRFLSEAGIARSDVVIWNAVPWVIHAPGARNRPVRAGEVREGLAMLPEFLDLLPALAVVVTMGRVAGQAAPVLAAKRPAVPVIAVPHPSPTIVCTSPAIGARIAAGLAEAAALLARDQGGWPGRARCVMVAETRGRTMILLHILWPTFAMVALILVVWSILFAQRLRHMRQTPPCAEDFASGAAARAYFAPVEMSANNLSNLFEMPVLFFAIVPLLMGTQQAGIAQVVLAWFFVILRAVHSWIHIGPKNVRARAQVYIASVAVLSAMWVGFFIDFAAAAVSYSRAMAQVAQLGG